jgi:hypothetical protein
VGTRILDPGESVDVPSNCGIEVAPEHAYLLVVVDHADIIEESDEGNNIGVFALPPWN